MALKGLKHLVWAKLTEDTGDTLTYGVVKELPGAISLSVNPTVNTAELYADDQLWESDSALGVVNVSVGTASLPLETKAAWMGAKLGADGVLVESSTDTPPYIALGFKALMRGGKYRYVWLLKGKAQPVEDNYQTKKENIEYQTPTINLAFMPRIHDQQWKRTADEGENGFSGEDSWFSDVPTT